MKWALLLVFIGTGGNGADKGVSLKYPMIGNYILDSRAARVILCAAAIYCASGAATFASTSPNPSAIRAISSWWSVIPLLFCGIGNTILFVYFMFFRR